MSPHPSQSNPPHSPITPELYQQVRAIFHDLLDLHPTARAHRLAQVSNPILHAELQRLLAQITASNFLDHNLFSPNQPGTLIANRFRITRLLGRGGMGEVFEADDLSLHSKIALKTISPHALSDPSARARFLTEVQAARRVTHRNVCRLFDYFETPSGPAYVAMELLPGDTLLNIIDLHGPFSIPQAAPILAQILDGLEAIHNAGIIHRDLKPGNIILTPDSPHPRPVILDFGLARSIEAGSIHTHNIIGTASYMAPEQFQGESTIQSDIYALGLIAHFLVTGHLPSSSSTPPSPWAKPILTATASSPAHRFQNVAALRRAFFPNPLLSRRAIAASAALASTAAAATWLFNRPPNLSILPGAKLAIAPIQNATPDKDLHSIDILLTAQLGQSAHLRTLDPAWPPTNPTPASLITAAQQQGAQLLLIPSATPSQNAYQLSFQLLHLATQKSSTLSLTAHGRQAIFPSVRQAARWIRRTAGEPPADISELDTSPEEATTPSWPALSAFQRAQRQAAANRRDDALLFLDEALRHDPSFTLAHMRKADILLSLSRDDAAYQSFHSAINLLPSRNIGKKEELRIRSMYLADTWQYPAAVQSYEAFALFFPKEREPFQYRARPLALIGRLKESVEILRHAATVEPTADGPKISLALHSALTSDFQSANSLLAPFQNFPTALHIAAIVAFLQRDYPAIPRLFEKAIQLASPPARSRFTLFYSHLLAELGLFDRALHLLDQGIATDRDRGFLANLHWKLMSRFSLRFRQNIQNIDMQIQPTPTAPIGPVLRAELVATFARAGHISLAQQLAANFSPTLDVPLFRYATHRIHGELQLASSNFPAALAALQSAANELPSNWPREFLAFAYAKAGQKPNAAAAYLAACQSAPMLWHTVTPHHPAVYRDCLQGLLANSPAPPPNFQSELSNLHA